MDLRTGLETEFKEEDTSSQCESEFGGKSCSVALTSSECEQVTCPNGGTCTSWQVDGERYHHGMVTIGQGTMFFTLQLDSSTQKSSPKQVRASTAFSFFSEEMCPMVHTQFPNLKKQEEEPSVVGDSETLNLVGCKGFK